MRAECVTAITNAAEKMGRKLTGQDLKGIEDRIRGAKQALRQQDLGKYSAMTPEQRLTMAGEMAAKQVLAEAADKRFRAARDIKIKDKIMSYMFDGTQRGMSWTDALTHYISKVSDGLGGTQSAESLAKAISADYKRQLDVTMKYFSDRDTLGIIASKEGNDEFIRASRGQSTNKAAIEAYAGFKTVNDAIIAQFKRMGGSIQKLADWNTPQQLDPYRLNNLTEAGFVEKWIGFLDRQKYSKDDGTLMSDGEVSALLKNAYLTLTSGGANKDPGQGVGSLANKLPQHRQLHYTADGYIKAMELAGNGGVLEQIHSHIDSMSRDIALMETMGSNPHHLYQEMRAHAVRKDPATPETNSALLALDRTFDHIYGINRSTLNVGEQRFINNTKAFHVLTKLGSMIQAQIMDLGTIKATADAMNVPMASIMSNAVRYASSPEYRSSSRALGLAMESIAQSIARYGDSASTAGAIGKGAALVVKLQGATAWNNMWRAAFGNAMLAQTAHLNSKYKTMADLPEYDRKVLASKGVTDMDWQLWQMAERDNVGIVGSASVGNVDLKDIYKLIPERVAEIQKTGADLMAKYEAQSTKELGWLQGREKKFADYTARIKKMQAEITNRKDMKAGEAKAYQDYLKAMSDAAEAKHELSKQAASLKSMDEVRGFLADFALAEKEGRLEAKAFERGEIDYASLKAVTKGETLGKKLGRTLAYAEAQTRAMERKIAGMDKTAINKAGELDARLQSRMADLDKLRSDIDTRMADRQKIVDEYNNSIGKRMDEAAYDFRRESALKLLSMTIEETHMAVLEPSAGSKAAMTKVFGSGYGTLIGQFNQFPVAYYREAFLERMKFAETMGDNKVHAAAKLFALTSVLGGISLLLGDVSSGKDPRDITKDTGKFMFMAMMRGGGLGPFNALIEAMSDPDASTGKTASRIFGPTASTGVEAIVTTADMIAMGYAAAQGDEKEFQKRRKEFSKEFYNLVKSNTPFQNFWPTKAVFHNVLLHDLHELAHPGYMERAKESAQKRYNSGFWISDEGMRAPEFGNILGKGE